MSHEMYPRTKQIAIFQVGKTIFHISLSQNVYTIWKFIRVLDFLMVIPYL